MIQQIGETQWTADNCYHELPFISPAPSTPITYPAILPTGHDSKDAVIATLSRTVEAQARMIEALQSELRKTKVA